MNGNERTGFSGEAARSAFALIRVHFRPRASFFYPLGGLAAALLATTLAAGAARAESLEVRVNRVAGRGLDWVASTQSRMGSWSANDSRYPTAMTALAGVALLQEGSTTTQGKYSKNIRLAVDYLLTHSRPNGLIGDQFKDDRYTYGHGYAMLFLSQVLGEEDDLGRRKELIDALARAVEFSGNAQTAAGGWGYVSAKDSAQGGGEFDEGSTTITQVQGLRGCRNAGIPVPKEIIDKAIDYIRKCTMPDGAVQYSSKGGGPRPAISAAAVACLFNAGEYDNEYVPKLLKYCEANLSDISNQGFGHWHYAHYYYSQVKYREDGKQWETYREKVFNRLLAEATDNGKYAYWTQGYIGPIYTTAINLTILQLDKGTLPIYQR